MSFLDEFVASPLATRLGWVFLHFLWQGALIAGGLWLVSAALGKERAQVRYFASCVALGLMLVVPVATFFLRVQPEPIASLPALLAALESGTTITGASGTDWRALVPALAVFWLLGTLVQQARLLYLWWGTERLRNAFQLPLPTFWQDAVASMRERLGIGVPVRVVESAAAEVPTVVGWLAPIILVPTSALLQLSTEQLRMVLAHELAHIRRHDYVVNLIQTAVESLLFFHPAVWWISHRLRVEREYCCDDIAVGLDGDALIYARALERLETLREGDPCLALAATGGSLMQRIQRLVKPESTARKSLTLSFLPVVVLLAGALSSTAFGFVGSVTASQDEKEMSDQELERRIGELRRQIERLESRLGDLKGERRSTVRFGHREPHVEVHVEPRHEAHAAPRHEAHAESRHEHGQREVDSRVRRFDVRFGDGHDRTIEIEIPEIHVPEVRFGQGDVRLHEIRIPEMRFGPDGGQRFQIHIPEIDIEDLQGKFEVHLEELEHDMEKFEFRHQDGEDGNVFIFGEDFEFDPKELHGKLKTLHEFDMDELHGKLELLHESNLEGLHEHIQEAMKNVRFHGLKELQDVKGNMRFDFDFDADEIQRQIHESMQKLHDQKGSAEGMRFLFEIDSDAPEGKARGFRWSSKDGEEPGVWLWRSGEKDGSAGGHEPRKDSDPGAVIDWKLFDGSKDA